MEEFFQMDGYAKFIWPAYVIVSLVMAGLWFASHRRQRTSADKLNILNQQSKHKPEDLSHEA